MYQSTYDQKYLAELFVAYQELIFGVCLKYFKNKADAEDGLMSVYEQVSKKLKTHQVDNLRPWLYVLTKNHCLEKLRKKGKAFTKEKEAANMYSDTVFHLDSIDKEEKLNKLENCMDKLIKEQKNCIRLFYFEKKSYQEIAESDGMAWSKVRSYIQNGRRMLKKCMEA